MKLPLHEFSFVKATAPFLFATIRTDQRGNSSVNSANRASVLPVNKVPPLFSSSAIEDMVSVLGISSVGYSCRMVMPSCGLAESALSCMTGIRQLHKPVLENLGAVYPTVCSQGSPSMQEVRHFYGLPWCRLPPGMRMYQCG